MIDINKIPSPCYVMEEKLLRNNLSLIKSVKERAGVNIILAFKAFALWKAFPIVREYIPFSTASSKFEAQLAFEEMGSPAHTYSPAYTEADFPLILRYSSHVTFNSLSQFHRFYPMVRADGNRVSCGLRINPEYSDVETDLYNPCAPGSRMGVTGDLLGDTLPEYTIDLSGTAFEGARPEALVDGEWAEVEDSLAGSVRAVAVRSSDGKHALALVFLNAEGAFHRGESMGLILKPVDAPTKKRYHVRGKVYVTDADMNTLKKRILSEL